MGKHTFLAFDLGATSGCAILGTLDNGKLALEEISRFTNDFICIHRKYYWNIYTFYSELLKALKITSKRKIEISAIGIDTWGVDFVHLAKDGTLIQLPRAYRDPYTSNLPQEFAKKISKDQLYDYTGLQTMEFNSLFQLFAKQRENDLALSNCDQILFLPDALTYLLTGEKRCEYTIASTSQLLNARKKTFEPAILESLDLRPSIFPPLIEPGERIGNTTAEINKLCSIKSTPVIAVASHDTGSAVVAVPAKDKHFAYISSGTWSLMGIEVDAPIITAESAKHNFTNEGGIDGTIRFLKNIAGMWLLEECRREWLAQGEEIGYQEITDLANERKPFEFLIDPDDASFAKPDSMVEAIRSYCKNTNQNQPQTKGEIIRCIFDSLSLKYKYIFDKLQDMAPFEIHCLHVIGGGSQNDLLNQMTANALNIPVLAGPTEATAIGNIMVQAMGVGLVKSLDEIRAVVRQSTTIKEFKPQNSELWKASYQRFTTLIK